ncbi:TIM barrel metal-dependent hydrolase [Cadophora sp. DSE1049]|nr:TIM barrel metal-dependent hydrolase [Cadophora sp. DSE1049]
MGSIGDLGLPEGAWDSHVHVVDETRFPFHPDHPYRPKTATLDDLLDFESRNGIYHVCLVAISVYSTDNRSLLDALLRLKGQGRGVACIDPATVSDAELKTLHNAGVRGVRLNLKTRSEVPDKAQLVKTLRTYADKIRSLKWALQIYVSLDQIPHLAEEIPKLGIPVVLDHLGGPKKDVPAREQRGYREFMELLRNGYVWTKMSGAYRFSEVPDLDEYARTILRVAPDQVVWASDWPHTGGVSVPDFVERCKEWCDHDEGLMRKLWVENPRRLWQFES